jgi:hypothetical protein
LGRNRRLAKDYENLADTLAAVYHTRLHPVRRQAATRGRRLLSHVFNDIASIKKAINIGQGAAAEYWKAKLELYRIDEENKPE